MALVAERAFFIALALHGLVLIEVKSQTARCIASENDRRTWLFAGYPLEQHGNHPGQAGGSLARVPGDLGRGSADHAPAEPPGWLDGWLNLAAYAGNVSTGLFLAAFAIWFSATAPDTRRAVGSRTSALIAWFTGPLYAEHLLPRLGVRLPARLHAANA